MINIIVVFKNYYLGASINKSWDIVWYQIKGISNVYLCLKIIMEIACFSQEIYKKKKKNVFLEEKVVPSLDRAIYIYLRLPTNKG